MTSPGTIAAQTETPPSQMSFAGRRLSLLALLATNLLLTIATVGVYRFWAKTRIRRFFWHHTRLLGDPFEYLGTAVELLVGFLVAVVILAPLSATFSLLQFFLADTGSAVPNLLNLSYVMLLAFLIQVAVYRMRRYRLTRTAWRGIRLGLDGSAFRFAAIWFGYSVLTLLTLGLARPWLRVATIRYTLNNVRFGTTRVTCAASGLSLFLRYLLVISPLILSLVLFTAVNWALLKTFFFLSQENALGGELNKVLYQQLAWWPLLLALISFPVWFWYRVAEFRHFVASLRLGELTFRSGLGSGFVFIVYLAYWALLATLIFVVLVLVALVVPGTLSIRFGTENPVVSIIILIVFYSLSDFVRTAIVDVALLRRATERMTLANPQGLELVAQSSADLPGHGEGLADALDVGGF